MFPFCSFVQYSSPTRHRDKHLSSTQTVIVGRIHPLCSFCWSFHGFLLERWLIIDGKMTSLDGDSAAGQPNKGVMKSDWERRTEREEDRWKQRWVGGWMGGDWLHAESEVSIEWLYARLARGCHGHLAAEERASRGVFSTSVFGENCQMTSSAAVTVVTALTSDERRCSRLQVDTRSPRWRLRETLPPLPFSLHALFSRGREIFMLLFP